MKTVHVSDFYSSDYLAKQIKYLAISVGRYLFKKLLLVGLGCSNNHLGVVNADILFIFNCGLSCFSTSCGSTKIYKGEYCWYKIVNNRR